MSKWIDSNIEERRLMLQRVSRDYDVSVQAIEKDWWVTIVLKALFQTSFAPYLLFKGGTSLSKGWHLIHRFSEDIDISFGREWFFEKGYQYAACTNKTQREKLRKKSRKIITTVFADELRHQLSLLGITSCEIVPVKTKETKDGIVEIDSDKDPTVLHVVYPSIVENLLTYILPIVKVEISCLSLSEPFEPREITSLIYDKFESEDDETHCLINTVYPERTFLEKAFLLNEEFQKAKPRTNRMSRHYYDLEKLMDTEYAKRALVDSDLYNRIIEHRKQYNTLKYVDYELNRSDRINFYPPKELYNDFAKDYDDMTTALIFKDPLTFPQLMQRISELLERFHKMK